MKHQSITIIIPSVLFILIILLLNPFSIWMPSMLQMSAVVALLVLCGVFAVFLWKEKPEDERDGDHMLKASRVAYFLTAGALLVGITVQGFTNTIDPWLLIALCMLVCGKIIARYLLSVYK